MKKPTTKEIRTALNVLVDIKFLVEDKKKYKFHPNCKKVLLTCKNKKVMDIIIEALYKAGYFKVHRTEREISITILLLTMEGN